jgi:hypothetical protein
MGLVALPDRIGSFLSAASSLASVGR